MTADERASLLYDQIALLMNGEQSEVCLAVLGAAIGSLLSNYPMSETVEWCALLKEDVFERRSERTVH